MSFLLSVDVVQTNAPPKKNQFTQCLSPNVKNSVVTSLVLKNVIQKSNFLLESFRLVMLPKTAASGNSSSQNVVQ